MGIGVLGARSMVARLAVLPAIEASSKTSLVAAASLSGPVPDRWAAAAVPDYQAVIDHPDVEAIYLPLPNNMHRAWTIAAAAAGKHVLCETRSGFSGRAVKRCRPPATRGALCSPRPG